MHPGAWIHLLTTVASPRRSSPHAATPSQARRQRLAGASSPPTTIRHVLSPHAYNLSGVVGIRQGPTSPPLVSPLRCQCQDVQHVGASHPPLPCAVHLTALQVLHPLHRLPQCSPHGQSLPQPSSPAGAARSSTTPIWWVDQKVQCSWRTGMQSSL